MRVNDKSIATKTWRFLERPTHLRLSEVRRVTVSILSAFHPTVPYDKHPNSTSLHKGSQLPRNLSQQAALGCSEAGDVGDANIQTYHPTDQRTSRPTGQPAIQPELSPNRGPPKREIQGSLPSKFHTRLPVDGQRPGHRAQDQVIRPQLPDPTGRGGGQATL